MNNCFAYRNAVLHAEKVSLPKIIKKFGTPLYVYSRARILENYHAYENAFKDLPHLICFAVKSNSNHGILKTLAEHGSGADIVSGGELYRALKAGIEPDKIVFAGVGKTAEEIEIALRATILLFNAESEQELKTISAVAQKMKTTAAIALRVNPDVEAHTHPHISTGRSLHKFGVPIERAVQHYRLAQMLPNLVIRGIHMHLGSQITDTTPFRIAMKKVQSIVDQLRKVNIHIDYFDIGGGAGIRYSPKNAELHPAALADVVRSVRGSGDWKVVLEPGRSIVGDAGILVTKVLYRKNANRGQFVVVDAGMNDFIRPVLYDAYHEIIPVKIRKRKKIIADIVGPVCETADYFGKHRRIEDCAPGDFLAIMTCGGYGFSMSSQYNSRPRPAEVMVNGDQCELLTRRETYEDLIRQEII